MSNFVILRTQKLKSTAAVHRSMKHAFRAQKTPNADAGKLADNTHYGANNVAEGMQAFRDALPEKIRKNAVLAIEYLITASPEAMNGKTREEQDSYFKDSLEWLRQKHGAENVVYAGIHRDESTPHMYAYITPKLNGKLNCRHFLGGSKALSAMQSEFSEKVGNSHGFKRGVQGSKATHTDIKTYYAGVNMATGNKINIKPDFIAPKTLGKKWGVIPEKETLEQTTNRLNKALNKHLTPVYALADNTNRIKEENEKLKKKLIDLDKIFAGLDLRDRNNLKYQADLMREEARDRAIEEDRARARARDRDREKMEEQEKTLILMKEEKEKTATPAPKPEPQITPEPKPEPEPKPSPEQKPEPQTTPAQAPEPKNPGIENKENKKKVKRQRM